MPETVTLPSWSFNCKEQEAEGRIQALAKSFSDRTYARGEPQAASWSHAYPKDRLIEMGYIGIYRTK